jgi:hypothetical protein
MPNPNLKFPIIRRLLINDYALFPGPGGNSVDHTFEPGVTVIVGINGIGKTTMLNLIYRLLVGPWDFAKAEEGVQLTRGTLTEHKTFDYFAKRDKAPTKATAMGEFQFGNRRLVLTRRLSDLGLISLTVDDTPVRSKPGSNLEDEIWRLSGCGRRYDFHLLMTSLFFFPEEKAAIVWEPEAQIEVFRILFLDSTAATELARLGREIQRDDSRRRNMLAELNRYKKRQIRAIVASSATAEVKKKADEFDKRAVRIEKELEQLAETALGLEKTRQANRQKLDGFKLDLEEKSRALEYLYHQYFASLFPSLPDIARNVFLNLVGDTGCTVCGSRTPGLSSRFQQMAASGECPVCGSPKEEHEKLESAAEFGVDTIKRQNEEIAELKEQVSQLETLNSVDDDSYRSVLRQRIDLQTKHESLAKEAQRLRLLLPADDQTKKDVENYIKVTEREIDEKARNIASNIVEYKGRLDGLRSEIESIRENLMQYFADYAGSFLAEKCTLIWKPQKIRLGEATEAIEYPTFAVQMTSAVSPSSGVTRITDTDVSESQKEFIDLAFRMAVLRAYSTSQGIDGSAMIVIETPESSLDSIFVENAGDMLRNWCVPTATGANYVIASCNLNRENMISALLGRNRTDGEKPSAEWIRAHVVNLLDIAAPNAALIQHRNEYLKEFENSTAVTNG